MDIKDNELLTRVGPGTPMGNLMRRYWIPARLSSEVLGPDTPPVRIKIMGEIFIAFRDNDGKVGVLDDACPHRGASLYMGRTGDGCVTCIYHGWKMTVDGNIVDTPHLQADAFKERNSARAFPTIEAGGIIWVYIGPPDLMPAPPTYSFAVLPDDHRVVMRSTFQGNWLQSLESSLDPSHLAILHADYSPMDPSEGKYGHLVRPDNATTGSEMGGRDRLAPKIEAEATAYGVKFAGVRQVGDTDQLNARVSVYQAPFLVFVPPHFAVMYTPQDDNHTAQTVVAFDPAGAMDADLVQEMSGFLTPGVLVDSVIQANEENRFLQDRASMPESWSGIDGLLLEDIAMINGMAPVVDRTKETLVASDIAIVRVRRLLIKAAMDLEDGIEPFQLGEQAAGLGAWEGIVDPDTSWQEIIDQRAGFDTALAGASAAS